MTNKINILKEGLSKINILLLSGVAFFIPIVHQFLSPLIGLWAITSISIIVITKH